MLSDAFLVQPPDTAHTSHTIIKMETNDTVFDDEVATPQGQSAHVQLFVYKVPMSAFVAISAVYWRIFIHSGPLSNMIQTVNSSVGMHALSYHDLIYFTRVCLEHFVCPAMVMYMCVCTYQARPTHTGCTLITTAVLAFEDKQQSTRSKS